MAKEPIKTDLFHFVTVRNPQLLTQNERKIGFVYFPAELVNSSHFMKDLAGLSTKQARKDHLETKAASFTNLKSVKAVRSTATGLYDFSQWLTKYKNTLTSEETEEQSTGVSTLSSISFVSLWDNMVYQTVTKNSLTICDAIVRM